MLECFYMNASKHCYKALWQKSFDCEIAKTNFHNILLLTEALICLPVSVAISGYCF